MEERRWFEEHDNIVLLVRYMADQPEYDKAAIAYAVEKPWKFEDVFGDAEAAFSERQRAQAPRVAF